MSLQTLPAPLLAEEPVLAGLQRKPRRSRSRPGPRLGLRIKLAACGILVPVGTITAIAGLHLEGATALTVLALGASALAAIAWGTAWLLLAVVGPLALASEAAGRISAGDLTGVIPVDRGGELRTLLQALQEMKVRLFGVVTEVRTGTTQVALNATQIARDNEALSQRTELQAGSLQETAASMEELTAAVRQNADTAQQANALVRAATGRAEQGGALMREVVQTMESIRESSGNIRDIIGVIDGIAFQTNILALNAAVEAARAGDQGRGFAVVAAEVRSLAQRSAQAAREVKDLIGASVDKVDTGGRRVDQAGQAMAEIVTAVRQVAGLIEQIDAASQEQSSGIEAINNAVARIDRTTQQNAALVKDASRTASAVQGRAVALMESVAVFELGAREHGNADEAVALVRRGCEFHRAYGRQALIDEVNKLGASRFVDRDLYLMVIGLDAVFLAHGNNPRTLGNGPRSKDVDGKLFVQEMARLARERGEGWVEYKWAHPVTDRISTKRTYLRREADVVVACGIYGG